MLNSSLFNLVIVVCIMKDKIPTGLCQIRFDDPFERLTRAKDYNLYSDITPLLQCRLFTRNQLAEVKQSCKTAAVGAAGLCGRRHPSTSFWLQAKLMSLSFYIINFNYPHKSLRFRHRGGNLREKKNPLIYLGREV